MRVAPVSSGATNHGHQRMNKSIACSIGVIAHNQEQTIGALLAALLNQHLHRVTVVEIIVGAGGCTDKTVPIVQEFVAQHP
jgi:glycosyltransferase involved in cell wall biosynthesis